MRVEANSVNAFQPVHGSTLKAFGIRVYVILGYEHGDTLFKRGDGRPTPDSAYDTVVIGAPSQSKYKRARPVAVFSFTK